MYVSENVFKVTDFLMIFKRGNWDMRKMKKLFLNYLVSITHLVMFPQDFGDVFTLFTFHMKTHFQSVDMNVN